jgi:ABC-2 type transport system ATP-binding protein
MKAIEVRRLVKTYGKRAALNEISFDVDAGEVFGFLGPNGAGKSTTINILTCQLRPTSGRISMFGLRPGSDSKKLKRILGVVSQDLMLNEYLTARQNLMFYGRLHGLSSEILDGRVEQLLERVELADRADELVRNYSKGMKQRLNLVLALVHDPEFLFLDEPTTGLDPKSRRKIWELIGEVKREGKTVIITTHYMDEAEKLCDRIAIIDNGEIVGIGSPSDLKRESNLDRTVEVEIDHYDDIMEDVKRFGQIKTASYDAHLRSLKLDCADTHVLVPELLAFFMYKGLRNIKVSEPTLEDVFLKMTGKSLKG